ncbi:DNA polymerase Y family protein [Stagnimonas aquatica]|uniref:DNA polymerase Y family protein n=1 Tax=Stagnimonas aquatica TaxID=2689987 RepID=A0A3N0VK65_9GAMM|nr:DNA polymerase Y family protein [Stagnimonas aquatica]ROH93090.1 DNA polymerase Y family protein [Stagnimonas aquatica]
MLWLCLDFPALGREALGVEASVAVLGAHGSHRWLITEVAGGPAGKTLPAGLSLAEARSRSPELPTRPRQPEAEREQLEALAHALYRFGSPVVAEVLEPAEPFALPRWRVSVEIGASLSLFGGVEALREQVLLDLLDWHCAARLGIAPSRLAAGVLAEAGETTPCLRAEDLPTRLNPLPIGLLPWPAATRDALASVGLARLGALFAAPPETLRQRFGAEVPRDLERLLARRAEPYRAIEPPPVFAARFELHGEVDNVETLLFPLKRLTQRYAAYLSARAVTAMHCRLELRHDLGAPTVVPLQLLSPSRDAGRWFEILRERLYRQPPNRAVRELHLSATDFLPISGSQAALFDAHRLSRERQALLEKLIARYGEPNLWRPALRGDHRPERAWAATGLGQPVVSPPPLPPAATSPLLQRGDSSDALPPPPAGEGWGGGGLRKQSTTQGPPNRPPPSLPPPAGGGTHPRRRPLWLLRQAKPIAQPPAEGLPERIETGWWDGAPAHRDYHRVTLGERSGWVYRDLDDGRWYLQGLWE